MEALLAPLLPVVRVLAVATAFPLLAGPGAPRTVRLAVAMALAFLLLSGRPEGAAASSGAATLLLLPFEVLLGLAIGYAFTLPFQMLVAAGDFAGQEMGLNTATQIDPVSGRPAPLLSRLFEMLGLLLFAECGGIRMLLRAIEASFSAVPSGTVADAARLAGGLLAATLAALTQGVALALPVALVLLLVAAFTTLLARVLPKLHVFDVAFAVRLMIAVVLVALLLPRIGPAFERAADASVSSLLAALGGR